VPLVCVVVYVSCYVFMVMLLFCCFVVLLLCCYVVGVWPGMGRSGLLLRASIRKLRALRFDLLVLLLFPFFLVSRGNSWELSLSLEKGEKRFLLFWWCAW